MDAMGNKPLNVASKLCCRACLNTDCKLFNIHENNLADAFACISGIAISRDGLPQHLCACCSALMIKYMSFRTLCINSYEHLMSGLLKRGANIDYTGTSQQHKAFYNLSLTAVETVDCIDVKVVEIKQEPADIKDLDAIINSVDFKIEVEENTVDIDNVMINVSKNENHVKIIEVDNENGSDVNGVVVENMKDVKGRKRNIEVKGTKKNSDIEIDDDGIDSVKDKKRKMVININKKLDIDCKGGSGTKDDKIKDLNDINDLETILHAKPVRTKKKKKTREEILEAKRQASRERYKKYKSDPKLLETLKQRMREQYLKKKNDLKYVKINERSVQDQAEQREKWRAYSSKRYVKKTKGKLNE